MILTHSKCVRSLTIPLSPGTSYQKENPFLFWFESKFVIFEYYKLFYYFISLCNKSGNWLKSNFKQTRIKPFHHVVPFLSNPALDGFMSTVEMNGTGTGRNGTVTGKMSSRFPSYGSRSYPLLLNGNIRQKLPFLTVRFPFHKCQNTEGS